MFTPDMLLAGMAAAAYAAPATCRLPVGGHIWSAVTHITSTDSVSLTFDDGPDFATDLFLQELEKAGVRATFFLIGEQVARNPNQAAAIVQAGHEVGIHGYRHRNHLLTSPQVVRDELHRARDIIESATGRRLSLFRPPYGVLSWASLATARRLGWTVVLWNRCGHDWEMGATPRSITAHVGVPRAGDIVLLHDSDRYSATGSWKNTLSALPLLVEVVDSRNLKMKTVGDQLLRQ